MLLYLTADVIGGWTGGSKVTEQEFRALKELGDPTTIPVTLDRPTPDPFAQDAAILEKVKNLTRGRWLVPTLAHCYSGCLPRTVEYLKGIGCKVSYTVAAHDREVSRREHQKLGMPFGYPHLTVPEIWEKYIGGYRLADAIVCPGSVPARTVRNYGPDFASKRIEIIPHGVDLPKCTGDCKGKAGETFATGPNDITDWDHCRRCEGTGIEPIKPLPPRFTVGYLGVVIGPDKGVRYLLEAWRKLDYKDGSLLVLAGRDSTSPFARHLLQVFGGGNVHLAGWQEDVSAFYDSLSLYCQPSASEGFGLEVLEAMAHGRPVICSNGAGAVDLVAVAGVGSPVNSCDAQQLADEINAAKTCWQLEGDYIRERATACTWDKIRERYRTLWRNLLR